MSASSTLIKPRQLQRLSAALVALLFVAASLLLTGVQPAAAAGNGQLNVRATAVDCAFTNVPPGDPRVPAESGKACVDVPDRWYPSETANSQAIQAGTGSITACPTSIKERAENIPAAMGGSSVATGDLECNSRTHSTPNLHASIFSGVDANGLPDLPAANVEWPAGAVQSCTITNAQVTDLADGTCGIKGVNRTSAQYYIMEGYVSFPAVVSGQVDFQASNIGIDGVARAEYLAFMASTDSSMDNLEFVGEAQTARNEATEFTVPVNVSKDITSQCSNVRAIRLYMQDNVEGSSATLRWNLGNGLEAIPAEYVSNTVPSIEGCQPPKALDNAETTNPGVPVDSVVLNNDTKGSAEIDPTSVRFLDGKGLPVDAITVPGEGVWTVNKETGVVTFAPLPTFAGVTKPVNYQVFDTNGLSAQAKVVVTVRTPPKALDNTETTNPGVPVDSVVLANDTKGSAEIDPTSVRFVNASGNLVDVVTVPGEGVWTVNKTNGVVTFSPVAGFTGKTTPVKYQITDLNKLTAQANVIVTINMPPKAVDNAETTNPGVPVDSVVLANDTKGSAELDPTTVRFVVDGKLVDMVAVPGEGTWTVNKETGVVTFTPEAGFTGVTTPVKYQVADLNKLTTEANVVVTVRTPPKAVDNAETTNPGVPVDSIVLNNDTKGSAELDPTTVRFVGPEGELLETVVVDGEGVWTVNKATGVVTFAPEAGFTGVTTPVRYQVADLNKLTTEANVVVTVRTPPKAVDNAETTNPGVPVDSIVLDNDTKGSAELDPTTVRFVVDGKLVETVTVPGEGVWTVNKETGVVTFAPEAAFTGVTTPVKYQVADLNKLTTEANVVVTVRTPPKAVDNAETTNPGVPVDSIVLNNDTKGSAELDPTTVRFIDADGKLVETVTVPGEGVWTVNKETGVVTFAPEADFIGKTAPVRYQVADLNKLTTEANVVVTVRTPPKAVDNAETTNPGVPVDSIVLNNDTKGSAELDPTTVRLVVDGKLVDTVTVPGEGVWTVDKATGVVTFSPEGAFTGETTPVRYQVADLNKLTTEANVVVTVRTPPKAVDNAETTNPGVPVDSIVLNNDTKGSAELDPTTVRFVVDGKLVDTVTVPGEGVWTVNKTTGVVTFAPESGFTGVTTPVRYQVADLNKLTTEANVVVTVTAPPAVPLLDNAPAAVDAPMDPAPASAAPVVQDDLAATGVSTAVLVISAALALLGGMAMVLTAVRRRQQQQ